MTIKNFCVPVHIGVTEQERNQLQEIKWTIEFEASSFFEKTNTPSVCYQEILGNN